MTDIDDLEKQPATSHSNYRDDDIGPEETPTKEKGRSDRLETLHALNWVYRSTVTRLLIRTDC